MGGANPLNRFKLPDVQFRTTDEMLEAFSFLGEDVAQRVVVTETQKLANRFEEVTPVKTDLYTPKIEGSEQEITDLSYNEARRLYGEDLRDSRETTKERARQYYRKRLFRYLFDFSKTGS